MPTTSSSPLPNSIFKPAVILHGGAGNISRTRLPPELYAQYRTSLLTYLRSTAVLLNSSEIECTALDAAVHAVSLMEDDELFNCGRGSVFTSSGAIEMEASVMVCSVLKTPEEEGEAKRGAGVMLVKNVRHPIRLAREVLRRTGSDGDGGNMHSQLSGPYVEGLARDWGLEFKPDEWFWTKRRWDEHRRGLKGQDVQGSRHEEKENEDLYLSQGTVGCVCLDRWGNVAVATSTGGMTNKSPGRIGDTPTIGAGFWAEAWDVEEGQVLRSRCGSEGIIYQQATSSHQTRYTQLSSFGIVSLNFAPSRAWEFTRDLLFRDGRLPSGTLPRYSPPPNLPPSHDLPEKLDPEDDSSLRRSQSSLLPSWSPSCTHRTTSRRALAISGTGNGDSFLRIDAARTAAAIARFSSTPSCPISLSTAVAAVAGPNGELQRSAGPRWGKTGEGEGGMIGIEVTYQAGDTSALRRGRAVFDFNCVGMFRAWIEEGADGIERERMMVFREEYA